MSRPDSRREAEAPLELESQFILRMPEEPATALRELLRSGANLKDRCAIRLESDMRYGEVRVDGWTMHAKVVDLPTVVESLKTIDNKSFYKTADVCQMMICKEEADAPQPEEEASKAKGKDRPFKVEKKFLWPHGVTPPSKNIRRRRFRKTLKKKYVEAPEIEKEVKRLLRIDNDAASVKWEVISEDEAAVKTEPAAPADERPAAVKRERPSGGRPRPEPKAPAPKKDAPRPADPDAPNAPAEHDIFGGAVSDSDEEEMTAGSRANRETNDNSHLTEYDSRLSDSNSSMQGPQQLGNPRMNRMPTQFAANMFPGTDDRPSPSGGGNYQNREMSKENIQLQLEQMSVELESLRSQRIKKEQEIASMENLALRQRFQDYLDNLIQDIMFKEMEYRELQRHLQGD